MIDYNAMSLNQKARHLLLRWTNELDAPTAELRVIEQQQAKITELQERVRLADEVVEAANTLNNMSPSSDFSDGYENLNKALIKYNN